MLNYLKIRKSNINFILLILSVLALTACEDVFETNIENKYIRLLSPKDSMISTTNLVNFSWEVLEGADSYNFQIVSNTFTNPTSYLCDSNVTTNFISFILPAGSYQWRVKGKNFGYSSNFSIRSFTISLSTDITGSIPQLTFPVNGDTSKNTFFLFKWNSIPYAVDYRYELWQGKVGSGLKLCSVLLDTNKFQYSIPQEGYYEWQVRGQNNSSNTPYSIGNLLCDTTRPSQAIITSPMNNVAITDSIVTLQWTRTAIPGSIEYDSLFIYSDSLMIANVGAYKIMNKTYSKRLNNGNYWWIVKPYDRAGNNGNSSGLLKFVINYTKFIK
ncbi:MAG: hypothetical protein NTZ33_15705 [Bacteroidetes bacterium]|nr:hypothetical protein [Bacteroidota bacterium]